MLLKNWKLASIATFSLSLARALSVAALSVFNGLMLRPSVATAPEGLVTIYTASPTSEFDGVSYPDFGSAFKVPLTRQSICRMLSSRFSRGGDTWRRIQWIISGAVAMKNRVHVRPSIQRTFEASGKCKLMPRREILDNTSASALTHISELADPKPMS